MGSKGGNSRLRMLWTAAFALIAADPACAAGLPACAGPIEAKDIPIVRVERNGDLVLIDGRAVRLEGILLPAGDKDHAPAFPANEAVATLSGLARGRSATLSLFEPKEDRYGRLRAQVFVSDDDDRDWLQIAMLRRGLARVSIAPDRHECASELYAAEDYARRQRFGIWATGFYDVRTPDDMADTLGTFQIVQGEVVSAEVHNGGAFLDFGSNWRKDFKVTISPEDMRRFRDMGVDPRNYEGLTLRVRGFVEWFGGPEIAIANPEEIEVVRGP